MRIKDIQAERDFRSSDSDHTALNGGRHEQLRNAKEGAWSWEVGNTELNVDDSWRGLFGIRPTEAISARFREELLHTDDKKGAISELNKFIDGTAVRHQQEYRMRHANGEYRWISSRTIAVRNEHGSVVRLHGTDRDITSEKHEDVARQREETKYRNLFQNSLVAMGTVKADLSLILEGNEKFWSFVNQDVPSRKSFRFDSLLRKRQKRDLLQLLEKEGTVDNYELQLSGGEDEDRWVLVNATINSDENVIDFVLKDITQTKANLIELQKVNFELDSFVYHASHDLRSPLRSILGLIDLYRMENDQEMQEECIDKIQTSVKKLDHLVIELLSISRNDRVNDPFTEINLLQEINSSIASYYNATDTRNLEITSKILQPVSFSSDATRIRIILNNLISNAIKYRSFRKELSVIHIDVKVDEEQAVIKISDNGEGIQESKLPNIFDMFYRATERSEGSGLGLYIVKKVADKLNASIDVESIELEGTTFTVTIPNGK